MPTGERNNVTPKRFMHRGKQRRTPLLYQDLHANLLIVGEWSSTLSRMLRGDPKGLKAGFGRPQLQRSSKGVQQNNWQRQSVTNNWQCQSVTTPAKKQLCTLWDSATCGENPRFT